MLAPRAYFMSDTVHWNIKNSCLHGFAGRNEGRMEASSLNKIGVRSK